MTPPTAERTQPARAGFGGLLLAEWTKLRSVPRWMLGLGATVVLTLLLSIVTAAGSGSDLNQHPEALGAIGPNGQRVRDELHFVHQSFVGDGQIVARVRTQEASHDAANAGVMIKASTAEGSAFVALSVTPGNGVRLLSNYAVVATGSAETAPRWLKLTRTGTSVTGFESDDGKTWSNVGSVEVELPRDAEAGLYVNSPGAVEVERQFGSSSSGERATLGTATFDHVELDADGSGAHNASDWSEFDTSKGFVETEPAVEVDGVFTISGSGELAVLLPDTDVTQNSLIGINLGQLAVIAVAVLFITAEYKRGMIHTTFAASPRRGRVLAAKAIVIGAATFVVGLVASLTAFFLAQPLQRSNGFGPPAYPIPSLSDGPVVRAIVGAAVSLALVAVFALALGAIMRRSAGAIATGIVIFILPIVTAGTLPLAAEQWLMRTTPVAGLSILQTLEVDHDTAVEPWDMTGPWAGLGVLAAYAAAALIVASWLLRRRDA